MGTGAASRRARQNPLSWICFALTEFRLLCFAQVGSICSLTGFVHFVHSIRPQIRLGLLAFTRFRISFRIFILKILHYINLVHMAVRSSVSQTRLHSRTKSASWICFALDIVVRCAYISIQHAEASLLT